MGFELFCGTLIALLFGMFVCFAGYRFFLVLLPIWGFFTGFMLGAQAIQAISGGGFLGDVTSWVVGFLVGAVFAVLSYLFYIVGVALLAGTFGYAIGAGFMGLIGVDFGLLVWIVGLVVGIALAVVVLMFNIQKWVIIIATAVGGAGLITGVMYFGYGAFSVLSDVFKNPVKAALDESPLLLVLFLVVAVAGVVIQWKVNQNFTLEAPEDRW